MKFKLKKVNRKLLLAIVSVVIVTAVAGLTVYGFSRLNSEQTSSDSEVKKDTETSQTTKPPHYYVCDGNAEGNSQSLQTLTVAEIKSGKLPTVAQDTPIYVSCRSDRDKAKEVETLLEEKGFTKVRIR